MIPARRRTPRGGAAGLAAPCITLALALLLRPSPAAAAEIEWQPLNAIYTTTRAAIEAAVRGSASTLRIGDPAEVKVAFVDLDEHPGAVSATVRPEVIVVPAPAACLPDGCFVDILTDDEGAFRRWTSVFSRHGSVGLGGAFRHGMRDLIVDGHRHRFDGARYRYTGALEAWSPLTDVGEATRAWLDEEMQPLENDDPAQVWVAFVQLHEGSAARDRRDLIVQNENLDWCGTAGCSIDVYTFDGQSYAQVGAFLGGIVDLADGFSHGLRDLMLGDVLFRFDGTRYVPAAEFR